MSISRRKFLKKSIIATAAAVTPFLCGREIKAHWAKGTQVHPHIDHRRVVGIIDSRMTRDLQPVSSWSLQEKIVVKELVWENLDKLACALTKLSNPEKAWLTIFLKPPRKSWAETVVAIKTNNIALQHTRSAVMSKICHVLVKICRINPENIHIYDGIHGGSMAQNTPFADLPAGVKIENEWGGVTTLTKVPEPWRRSRGQAKCLKPLVDGYVDILINIAMCKGHSQTFGGFTMTMKNHFGTFDPAPGHREGALDYLLAINKTPEILGPMDPQTGKVIYPRQQLCLLDALWASEKGPGGYPRSQPNFLAMGVFSPIFDYVLATRFRGEKMGWKPNMEATQRFLTEFGYTEEMLLPLEIL
jgi:hypothetical protein